jgi:endoglucanase
MRLISRIPMLLLAFFVVFTSCNGAEEVNTIILNNSSLALNGAGDKGFVAFTSTAGIWTASSSDEWCKITPLTGKTQKGTITVSAETNLSLSERKATISISAPNASNAQVLVTQGVVEESNILVLDDTEINVDANESLITLTLNSTSSSWTANNESDWLVVSPESGGEGEYSIEISVSKNTGLERSAEIVFVGNGVADVLLIVHQQSARYPDYSSPEPVDDSEMESDATQLAAKMHMGWNLGNSLEVPNSETGWGNPKASQALIDMVKNAGFNAIRIPCAWNSYMEDASTAKLKESWLNRVQEVVDYCFTNDMYVVINIHWDGGWLEENPLYSKQDEINDKQKAFWEQIAVHFRDYDEHLLFAGTNEVHANYNTPSTENIEVQQSFNQTFVDAVRSTGGKNAYRTLIVQAYNTNIDYAYDKMSMPSDEAPNRLIAEVHYYDPWDFCGAQSSDNSATFFWGNEAGYTNISGWGQEDHARRQFAKMKSKFVDKGIPVIMGEYGAVNRTASLVSEDEKELHRQSRAYYLKYVTQKMKENGIVPFYWDNGHTGKDGFALFDRNTKTVFDQQALDALIEGAGAGNYPQ